MIGRVQMGWERRDVRTHRRAQRFTVLIMRVRVVSEPIGARMELAFRAWLDWQAARQARHEQWARGMAEVVAQRLGELPDGAQPDRQAS